MVLVSAALLDNTGRALFLSRKMTTVLNCLTSLKNFCFLPRRDREKVSYAEKINLKLFKKVIMKVIKVIENNKNKLLKK